MDSKTIRATRRISGVRRLFRRSGLRPPVIVFALLLLGLTAYGAVAGVQSGIAATPPDCPVGTLPFFGDFPANNQGSVVTISACVPANSAPTPRAFAPASGDVVFTTPTPVTSGPTPLPTTPPIVITVVVTPTAIPGAAQPVVAPLAGIRPPNTGDGGLLP